MTNKVIDNKEKNMTNISNDIIIQETSNENIVANQVEEIIEVNNQPQESFLENNNTTTNVNTEKSSLEGTTQGGIYYMTQEEIEALNREIELSDEDIKSLKKPGEREDSIQQTKPTAEPSIETTPEAENTEVVE